MLNWYKQSFIFTCLIFIFIACKQADERSCFKSSGKIITKTFVKGNFTVLKLHPYLNYELIKDSMNYVEVTCGENMIHFIDVSVSDSVLTLTNNNKCRFLRGYDKQIHVKIHINLLSNIYYDGTETLLSNDTILANYCTIMMRDAGGTMDLKLKSKELIVYKINAPGKMKLSGKAWKARYENTSYNVFDARDLNIRDSVYFLNQGYGNMYLYTDVIDVKGRIEGEGNVYYKGNPALTQIQLLGKGQFLAQ
jgi:hypothetical protein